MKTSQTAIFNQVRWKGCSILPMFVLEVAFFDPTPQELHIAVRVQGSPAILWHAGIRPLLFYEVKV